MPPVLPLTGVASKPKLSVGVTLHFSQPFRDINTLDASPQPKLDAV